MPGPNRIEKNPNHVITPDFCCSWLYATSMRVYILYKHPPHLSSTSPFPHEHQSPTTILNLRHHVIRPLPNSPIRRPLNPRQHSFPLLLLPPHPLPRHIAQLPRTPAVPDRARVDPLRPNNRPL